MEQILMTNKDVENLREQVETLDKRLKLMEAEWENQTEGISSNDKNNKDNLQQASPENIKEYLTDSSNIAERDVLIVRDLPETDGSTIKEVATTTEGAQHEVPHLPYPDLELVNPQLCVTAPTEEQIDAYLKTDCAQELLRSAVEDKVEIARDFLSWAQKRDEQPSILLEAQEKEDYWFIGDLHGETRALVKILCYIRDHERPGYRQTLVFLGDFLDRGDDSWGTLALVEQLVLETRDDETRRVILMRGNHDMGLRRGENGYTSIVLPAESADALNAMKNAEQADVLFNSLQQLVRISPSMGELTGLRGKGSPETLFFCHGGVPHVDIQQKLRDRLLAPPQTMAQKPPIYGRPLLDGIPDDIREPMMTDFVWLRFVDAPHKIPNRLSHGSDIGYEDVKAYMQLHYALTGRIITSLVRGHDHARKGYAIHNRHEQYNPKGKFTDFNVITINALEANDEYLYRARDISLLHWQMGGKLEVIVLPTHHTPS